MFSFLCQSAQIKELCSKTTKRLLTSRLVTGSFSMKTKLMVLTLYERQLIFFNLTTCYIHSELID